MTLSPGARLGTYEIVSPLGAGGMGEVYKARDTRLDRLVAVKVLLTTVAGDPLFRERFDREARAISQLSHPHICTLYDVGHQDDTDFLVMEYLEGETLAARLQKGALPIADALRAATQIAEALDCAHQAAIVHRDLKPANVLLTKTGVKLLDFGLAKTGAVQMGRPADVSKAATTPLALTAQGTILGTLQYMAPEQVEGHDADARADIWAFGAVLHEMITGEPAFEGRNSATLIASVLTHRPPPVTQVQPAAPRAIERLVEGCLEKDREQRWQSIRDVKRQLTVAGEAPSTAAARPQPMRRRVLLAGGACLLGAGALVGYVGAGWPARGPASGPLIRFEIRPPARLTIPRFADTTLYLAPSPDGTHVVFVAGGRLWIKSSDRAAPDEIPGTNGAASPFWSPDGRSIAFFAGGQLKKKTLEGGPPQTLCAVRGVGNNGSWNSSGVMLFDEWGIKQLMRVSDQGGAPALVKKGADDLGWPQFLPDGRHYLFATLSEQDRSVHAFVGALDTADTIALPEVSSRAQYAAGHLLFRRDGALLAQPFDTGRFRLTGSAVQISDFVNGFTSTGFAAFSAAGPLLVYQALTPANRLVWVDREGRDLETVGQPRDYGGVRLAPDGSALAVTVRDPQLGTNDIWTHDFRRNIESRLTSDRGSENGPVWSPDGRTVVYAADRRGPPHLQAREVSGSDERQITAPSTSPQGTTAVTPDGRFVLYNDINPETGPDVMMAPFDGKGPPVPLVHTKARELAGRPSPDGKWLAYLSDQSGHLDVYVRPFRDEQTRWQISRAGGTNAKWRADGRELFYVEGGTRVMSVDVTVTPAFQVSAPRVLFSRPAFADYDVSADGRRFLFTMLDPEAETGTLSAVLNWPSLLIRK